MTTRLVSLGMLSVLAMLGGRARAAGGLDQNQGTYTDSFVDPIGLANIPEHHDVTLDAATDRVLLAAGETSGQLATVAVRPASYSGWRRVYLAYGAAAATDLEVRILGSDGQTYGPFAIGPSDDPAFVGMADISTVPAGLERANVLVHMAEHVFVVGAPDDPQSPDPADPADIRVRPTLEALRLTWAPKALVKLAVTATGDGLGAPGSREQVHVRVSVSVVDADDLVVYVPTPAPALDAAGAAVSLFGTTPAEQTIQGVTVPAGSQVFRLGKRKAGSSFSIDFEIVRPRACLTAPAAFPVVVHAVAANAPDLARDAAIYRLAANYGDPKPRMVIGAAADFVTIGEWRYEPDIGVIAPASYLPLGGHVRYDLQVGDSGGCAQVSRPSVVWASVYRPTETWPIWSDLAVGAGGAYTDEATNVNGIALPEHTVYWDLDTLAAQGVTPALWFALTTRTTDDEGAPIPPATQVAVRARVESRTQPQTAESGSQFLLGIPSIVDVRVAAGDGIGKSVSVQRAYNDNAELAVGIGESVMLFARADNMGTTRVDDVLIVDKVPAGMTFVSASMLGQADAVVYYQTDGAESAPSAPPDAVVLTNTLGPSWTTAPPADPRQVKWVAYRIAALGPGAFREHSPRKDATGVMVVTVDPTADNCAPAALANHALVHARLKTELGAAEPVAIDDTVAIWTTDSDPIAVVPKLPNFGGSWASPTGALVRGGSEQSFVFGVRNFRQSEALTDVANNTDVRVALPTMPDGRYFAVTSIDASGGMIDYSEFPAAVTIHYGAFPAGAARTVTVRVRAPRGALPNTPMNLIAMISGQSASCGEVRKGLAASARTAGNANIELVKDVDLGVARPGSALTYTLSYVNVGDAAGQGTWLVDRIRPGTTFAWTTVPAGGEVWFSNRPTLPDSVRADGAPLDEAAIRAQFVRGVVTPDGHYGPPASMTTAPTWIAYATDDATLTPPQMPTDRLATLSYAVTVNENDPRASEGTFIANEAAIFGRDLLPAISYEAATLVSNNPSLDITQECPSVVSAGEYFWATLGFVNNSTNDDLGVVVRQTVSPELWAAWAEHAFNPLALANHGPAALTPTLEDATYTFDVTGALAAGGSAALTSHEGGWAKVLVAPAPGTPSGTFVSVRGHAVAAGGPGTFPYEAYARCQVLVENADLFARLLVDQAEPVQDETVSLILGVSNEGAHDASGTDLTLQLPPGLDYVAGSARSLTPGWTIDEPVWDDAGHVLAWRADDGHGLYLDAQGPFAAGWMPGHSDDVLVLVRAHVGAGVTPGTTLPVRLTLSAETGEDSLYTNEATVVLHTPLPSPWVRLAAPVVARPGDAIALELRYGNLSRQVTGPIAVIARLFDGPDSGGAADVTFLGSAATHGEALWLHDAQLDAPAPPSTPPTPPPAAGAATRPGRSTGSPCIARRGPRRATPRSACSCSSVTRAAGSISYPARPSPTALLSCLSAARTSATRTRTTTRRPRRPRRPASISRRASPATPRAPTRASCPATR